MDPAETRTRDGVHPDGTRYLMKVPPRWDGTLLLWSYGPPRPAEAPAWDADEPLVQALLERGHAIAGCGSTRFWPIEEMVPGQLRTLDLFEKAFGSPARTVAMGRSIGGLMTASLVQLARERLAGGLVLCGTLGGGIATHDQQLDCTFAFKTLLAPNTELQLVRIQDPAKNVRIALEALEAAQATDAGRARLALAATLGSVAGWFDPAAPRPTDAVARQREQYMWLRTVDWHVFLEVRAVLEERGRGNPSSNRGVDHRALFERTPEKDVARELYEHAGLDLEADLDKLNAATRIDADEPAVEYFERYIAFDGRLGIPVMTLHSPGDGLVPVDHVRSYRDVVEWAGDGDLLRQLYVARGGHCVFTTAEVLVALERLLERIRNGSWPELSPGALNAAVAAYPAERTALPRMFGSDMPGRTGRQVEPAFVDLVPPAMARAYDIRQVRARRQ